jgi:hypothetical protein
VRRTTGASRPPSVTVAVPTRNRAKALVVCLNALSQLDYPEFEILVVDNGSTDDTAAVVQSWATTAIVPVRYAFEPKTGTANARNRALQMSTSDLVGIVDDDCYPARDWLQRIAAEFADPSVGYVGGRLLLHDSTDARFTINDSTVRVVCRPGVWNSGDDLPGTGMALRRAAMVEIGGFDPLMGPGSPLRSGEDIDVHWRLWAAGWVGIFTPDAVTYHAHGRKPGSPSLDRIRDDYAIARGGWYAKRIVFGPHRFRTFYAWTVWELRRQSMITTWKELRGFFRYLRLAIPRLLRGGMAMLQPPIDPISTESRS